MKLSITRIESELKELKEKFNALERVLELLEQDTEVEIDFLIARVSELEKLIPND